MKLFVTFSRLLLGGLLFFSVPDDGICQDSTAVQKIDNHKNLISLEIGGNSPIISVNFERTFSKLKWSEFSFRTGIGFDYQTWSDGNFIVFTFPLEISHILFKSNHHLVYGVGITPFLSKSPTWNSGTISNDYPIPDSYDFYYLFILDLGYRYQRKNSKWVYQIVYSPILINSSDIYEKNKYRNQFGISVGKKF